MKKNFKSYSILLVFTLLISYSMCNIIPDLSLKPKLDLSGSLSTPNSNQNIQSGLNVGFPSNPFGFDPFKGLNLNQDFFKIPQLNQQQGIQQQGNQQLNQQQLNQQQGNQQQLNQQTQGTQQQLNQQQGNQQQGNQQTQGSQLSQQQLIQQFPSFINPQQQQNINNQQGQNINTQQGQNINSGTFNQNSQTTTQQQSLGPFKFSSTLKHPDITATQNRVKSDLTGTQKIFMMDLSLRTQCRRGCTSEFRINQNSGWMTLGVCDKNRVVLNNLKWNRSKLGHGTYMIGSFGGTWSNLNQTENDVMKSFRYTTNDILRVTFSPRDQTIIFDKKGSNDSYTMPYDWRDQQLRLCGILYYANDQIQYLGTKFIEPLNQNGLIDDFQSPQIRLQRQLKDSKIRLDRNDIRNLRTFFDNRFFSLKLCYRGSENKFSASAFHSKCDNRANTMVLVESNLGKKFGAYTPVIWDTSSTYGVDSTNKSFLFSLTHNQKSPLTSNTNTNYRGISYGPTFGSGHDLYISDNSFQTQNSYCRIGNSYIAVSDCTRLVGGSSFKTIEYEVYEVIFEDPNLRNRNSFINDDFLFDRQHVNYGFRNLRSSTIRLANEDINNLRVFFDRRVLQLRMCYRASENSFSVSAFHSKCDGQSNTLTLIQTSPGKKIGAYTPLAWDSSSAYGVDSSMKSFLFSLTNNQKMTLKDPTYTIYKGPSYGPTFGGGHDLYIRDQANTITGSYCNIPYSYNYAYTSTQAQNRFCGGSSSNLTIRQYEIYQVIFE